ncbi:hypothetical protein ABT093_40460 [Kitasatospora sp. NPDC002551]|uniref:hypothetical protein n=1 Tax=unclassified Kitasatospora TaxID=2633591 RepID=UPI0033245723
MANPLVVTARQFYSGAVMTRTGNRKAAAMLGAAGVLVALTACSSGGDGKGQEAKSPAGWYRTPDDLCKEIGRVGLPGSESEGRASNGPPGAADEGAWRSCRAESTGGERDEYWNLTMDVRTYDKALVAFGWYQAGLHNAQSPTETLSPDARRRFEETASTGEAGYRVVVRDETRKDLVWKGAFVDGNLVVRVELECYAGSTADAEAAKAVNTCETHARSLGEELMKRAQSKLREGDLTARPTPA